MIERMISEGKFSAIIQRMKLSVVAKSMIMKGENIAVIVIYFHITFRNIDCSFNIKNEDRLTIPPANPTINRTTPISEGNVLLEAGHTSISKDSSFKLTLRPLISSFSMSVK
jgi:hypothetical protein